MALLHHSAPALASDAPRADAADRRLFLIVCVLASVVHWIPHFPAPIDLAQHAGQMRLLSDWLLGRPVPRELLTLNFFTPYLPAYVLGAALTPVFGAVVAVKLLWTAGTAATLYMAVRLRRVLGGPHHTWDWLLLAGLFGTTFQWGFLTFLCAVPLGLFAIEQWIAIGQSPTVRRELGFVVTVVLLFFTHALVTAWTLTICGLLLLVDWYSDRWTVVTFVRRGLPLAAPVPVALWWFAGTRGYAPATMPNSWDWSTRYPAFFAQWLGIADHSLALLIGGTLLAIPFVTGARLRRDARSLMPLLVTLAVLLAGPNWMSGNALTYNRFFTLLSPALLCAMTARDHTARPSLLAKRTLPLLASGIVLACGIRMVRFAQEQSDFVRIVRDMAPGRRVLALLHDRSSTALWHSSGYLHAPVWYQAVSGGFVEPNFAGRVAMIVRFKVPADEAVPFGFEFTPDFTTVKHLDRFAYIIQRPTVGDAPGAVPPAFTLKAREGRWYLYGRTQPGQ